MDRLILIDDEEDVQYSFRRIFDGEEMEISTAASGEEGLSLISQVKPDLVIMDVRMGGMSGLETLRQLRAKYARLPVIMMTAYGTTQTAIEAMKLGAYDYLLKPFDVPKLKEIVRKALDSAKAMRQVVSYEPLLESEDYDIGIVGRSEPMQKVFKTVGQLATSDATTLITGESGTGKELVARAIFHHSTRSQQCFLAINCAAITENLLESELFGHEKGAFTGASSQRIGKFEQCNHGTIFLDEIGDMTFATQTKILRVLQSGTFERVGGNKSIHVDVRVIAATNKLLEQAVAERKFREDLFYRLNVVRIEMPPLRDRVEDIPLLVNYFLKKFAQLKQEHPKSISTDTIETLMAYRWPGNVRELENVIQRALVMTKGEAILKGDLPDKVISTQPINIASAAHPSSGNRPTISNPAPDIEEESGLAFLAQKLFQWAKRDTDFKIIPAVERELIIHALVETDGNQVQAAKLLGITRATLRKRVEKFGIKQELLVR